MTDGLPREAAPNAPRREIGLVVAWMAGALVSFSAIAIGVRSLARTMSVFELLALRNVVGLALLGAAALCHAPFRRQWRPANPALHVVRNGVHFASQYGWAWALTLLPLATVFALEFTAPIWLALLAVPLLGERLTRSRIGAIALGFLGTLVILRPGAATFQPAALAMLAVALGFAATAVATKALTRTNATFTILLWMNAMQLALNLVGSDPAFWTRLGPEHVPGIAMVGLGGLLSHLCLTQAYRHGDAILVMPLDFLRIPAIAVVGFLAYGEPLDPLVFAGSGLVVAGILWNLAAEARRPAPALSPSRRPGSGPAS